MEEEKERARRDAAVGGLEEAGKYAASRERAGEFYRLGKETFERLFPRSKEAMVTLGKLSTLYELPYVSSDKVEGYKYAEYQVDFDNCWTIRLFMFLNSENNISNLEAALESLNLDPAKQEESEAKLERPAQADASNTYEFHDSGPTGTTYIISLIVAWHS